MSELPQNETRERIMDIAEELFMARGYNSVKLRDIADAVGMKHASLYYYVPKGKDQLFAEVVRRCMHRHHTNMKRVIAEAGDDFREQLYALSDWLVSQPPLDLARMAEVDFQALSPDLARELEATVMLSLNEPIIDIIQQAMDVQVAHVDSPGMASMSLLTILQGVHFVPMPSLPEGRKHLGRRLVNMLLNGWLAR